MVLPKNSITYTRTYKYLSEFDRSKIIVLLEEGLLPAQIARRLG